jgi:hypothetical protein
MRWEQGRETIVAMINGGQLEQVPASREHADVLLDQARLHVQTARTAATQDPSGAYQLLYDAARKALAAILENQGLRATSRGGHLAVLDAVSAQLDPPLGKILRPFDRMRRRRNTAEYPRIGTMSVTPDEVAADLPRANEMIDLASRVLDQMNPF